MSKTNKILLSAIMLVGNGVVQKLIGLVSTIVLARILLPEDFAVVAIAYLVILLAEVFTNTGSEQFVLSRGTASKSLVNSAWTLDLMVKSAATILICILAYPVALFYDKPELLAVILVLGVTPLLTGLMNPGLWRLKRQQKYKAFVIAMVISKVFGVILTISLAIMTKSYWALVIGQIFTTASASLISYFSCSYRPKLTTQTISTQLRFSSFMIGQEFFGYFKANIDSFFISKFYSNTIFGHFHIMKYIAVIPSLNLMIPLAEPLLVEMSKKQHDKETQGFKYTVTFIALAMIAIPISIFMYVNSLEIVAVLLGANWVEYHSIFGYMGLLVTSFFMATHCKRVLMVKSKTNFVFAYEFVAVTLVLLAVGLNLNSHVSTLIRDRVLIEIVAACFFFIVTTIYYLKEFAILFAKKIGLLVVMAALISILSMELHSFSQSSIKNEILRLVINSLGFICFYLSALTIAYFTYYKTTLEGQYLSQIMHKLLQRTNK